MMFVRLSLLSAAVCAVFVVCAVFSVVVVASVYCGFCCVFCRCCCCFCCCLHCVCCCFRNCCCVLLLLPLLRVALVFAVVCAAYAVLLLFVLLLLFVETGGRWTLSFIEEMAQAGRETHRSGNADPHSWRGPECCRSLAPGRSPLPWLQVRTTRCRGSMERHLTWPTCLGLCERVLLSVLTDFDCGRVFSCLRSCCCCLCCFFFSVVCAACFCCCFCCRFWAADR